MGKITPINLTVKNKTGEKIEGHPITSLRFVLDDKGNTLEDILKTLLKKGLLQGCTLDTSNDGKGMHININIDSFSLKDNDIIKCLLGFNNINGKNVPYFGLGFDGIGNDKNYMTFASYPSVFNPINSPQPYTEWAYQFSQGKYISMRLKGNGDIELVPEGRVSIGKYVDGSTWRELGAIFEKNGQGCIGTYTIEVLNLIANYVRATSTLHLESNNGKNSVVLYGDEGTERAMQPNDSLNGLIQLGTPWGAWKSLYTKQSYSSAGVVINETTTISEIEQDNLIDNIEFINTLNNNDEIQIDLSKVSNTNLVKCSDKTDDVYINESELLKLAILEIKKLKEEVKNLKNNGEIKNG